MEAALGFCAVLIVALTVIVIVTIRDCVRAEVALEKSASKCEEHCEKLRCAELTIDSLRRTINTRDEQITAYERRLDSIGVIAQTKRNEEWQQEMESDIESIIEAAKNLEERWETES